MGKKVIITGGLGGLGRAVERAFLDADYAVALIDRAPAPDDHPFCIGDVDLTDEGQAFAAFDAASAKLGGADVLVNIAGGFRFDAIATGDPRSWSAMFAVNLTTCVNMCRAAARSIGADGAIVNIGAMAAERSGVGMAPYAASKAAVARLTESLAAELEGRIRVNAVLPLTLDTPQNRADMPDVDPRCWTSTSAVADVIVFLASTQARSINGALIPVTAPAR